MSSECITSDQAAFEAAEKRLSELERRIYSNQKRGDHTAPIVPKLASFAQEIGDALGRRERITPLFRKLNELEKYLDPAASVEVGLSIEARAELILAEEARLRKANELFDSVKAKKSVLDSEALKNVPSLEGKLNQLAKIHLDQNAKGHSLTEESLNLIDQYNEAVEAITQTFVEYDKALTAAEEAQNVK